MPYICMTRDDVANGTVQVLDLFPNTSQRNLIYDGPGQTRYINRAVTSAVTNILNANGAVTDTMCGATRGQDAVGLGAYVMDTMTSDGGTTPLTTAQCTTVVEEIMALVDAASAVTLATISTAVANAGIVAFDATSDICVLEEILKILAGAHYKVPKETACNTKAGAFVFHTAKSNLSSAETVVKNYVGDEFHLSLNSGHIAGLATSTRLFGRSQVVPNKNGVSASMDESSTGYPARQLASMKNLNPLTEASARIVVVYADDGSVLA